MGVASLSLNYLLPYLLEGFPEVLIFLYVLHESLSSDTHRAVVDADHFPDFSSVYASMPVEELHEDGPCNVAVCFSEEVCAGNVEKSGYGFYDVLRLGLEDDLECGKLPLL